MTTSLLESPGRVSSAAPAATAVREEVVRPAAPAPARRTRTWPPRLLLAVFLFLALESLLLAVTVQGRWLILLAPGLVCAAKAWETWRKMRRESVQAASDRAEAPRI